MKTYQVIIKETIERETLIRADNAAEAEDLIEDLMAGVPARAITKEVVVYETADASPGGVAYVNEPPPAEPDKGY